MKKFKGLLWGGITGAFLLAGFYIVFIIIISYAGRLLPASGPALQKLFGMDKWTFEGIHTAFIIAVSLGVIFGALVGSRSPQLIQKWFAPIASLGVPAILVGWFLYVYAGYVDVPRGIKIVDCTNSIVKTRFKFPKGRNYHLVIATALNPINAFSGHVSIKNGMSSVVDFPIQPEQVSWLNFAPFEFNLTGDVINTNSPALHQFIHPQTNYDIEIDFDQPPPPSTSLWLYWLQAYKDKNEN